MYGPRRTCWLPIGIVACLVLLVIGVTAMRFFGPLVIGAVLLGVGVIILMQMNAGGDDKTKRDDWEIDDAYGVDEKPKRDGDEDFYDGDEKPKRVDSDWR